MNLKLDLGLGFG